MKKLIFLLLFTSCSFIDDPIRSIDPELNELYNEFIQEGLNRGIDYIGRDIIIEISQLETGVGGEKSFINGNILKITLSRSEITSDIKKEIILFHELGHGILNRRHINNKKSLMRFDLIESSYYVNNKEKVLDELFSTSSD